MRLAACAIALFFALFGAPVMAGEAEIAAIKAVLAAGPVDTGLFSAAFLKAVPPAQIEAGVAPLKTLIGPVQSVEPRDGQTYAVETATHEMLTDISLDADGKIGGLLFHVPVDKVGGIEDLLKQIGTIAPQSAYLVMKDGRTLYAADADAPLAVGSAFKLGVLKALRDEIDAGVHKWDEVVALEAGDISLPSGTLQTWPVGSPLTLHTLAALMISISDNTAADVLVRVVGRDKVEAALGIAPVLTTRELFTLKATPGLKAKYQAGDLTTKRSVLAMVDLLPLPDGAKVGTPHDAGVEYDLPASKLCALIDAVGDLDVTRINPGIASKPDWASLSFKGGSEIGVLSFTTLATGQDGARYCVSAIWNGPVAIDESAAAAAYAGVLAKLARGG